MIRCALAALLVAAAACAGSELTAESRGIRELIQRARQSGAYRCAPGALALAESHVEFADQELQAGEHLRARDHLRIADWNAREAVRLSGAERCVRRAPGPRAGAARGDADNDGVPDARDKCPRDAEDRDGFEDEDGCAEPDDDEDGVLDSADRCPRDAEDQDGFEDHDGCPEPDNDRDGVTDAVDRCPVDAEDRDGFQDEDGCPDLDDDKDGVPDREDRCPRDPGARADGGCPSRQRLIEVTSEKIETREPILFEHAGKGKRGRQAKVEVAPTLSRKSQAVVDEVAAVLKSRPAMRLRIEGHTDARGSRASNVRLSKIRADIVKAHLVDRGVEASRLETMGLGPDQPIETNKTAAGREKNQRIEFVIVQP